MQTLAMTKSLQLLAAEARQRGVGVFGGPQVGLGWGAANDSRVSEAVVAMWVGRGTGAGLACAGSVPRRVGSAAGSGETCA